MSSISRLTLGLIVSMVGLGLTGGPAKQAAETDMDILRRKLIEAQIDEMARKRVEGC